MSRTCVACHHDDRAQIDSLLAQNVPLRKIAGQFGISDSGLHRHKSDHLSPSLASAQAAREAENGLSILDQLHDLQARTMRQLERAEQAGHRPSEIARIVRECRENLAVIGRLLGQFPKESATIDNRTQILALGNLTVDELRRLAALGPTRRDGYG